MGDIIVLPEDGSGGGGSTEQRLFIEASLLALQATTPDEGFLGFAQDSDLYYYYDGAAWNLIETKIDHDNLVNFVANEHVDHSAVTLTAGTGLSGGGDITASRTFDLANTAVVAGSYGAAGTVGTFTVDAQGRLTAATDALIDIGVSQVNDLSNELASLTDAEVQQLQNIGANTISGTQWGYLGATNQGLSTTDNVTFADIDCDVVEFGLGLEATPAMRFADNTGWFQRNTFNEMRLSIAGSAIYNFALTNFAPVVSGSANLGSVSTRFGSLYLDNDAVVTGAVECATVDTGQGANELYAMDQNVRTSDDVTFTDVACTDLTPSGTLASKLENGRYTPTIVVNTGSSISTFPHMYSRVGNIVTMSGVFTITTDGSGDLDVEVPLPIASSFSLSSDALGTASVRETTGGAEITDVGSAVFSDSASNRLAVIIKTDSLSTSIQVRYMAQYEVK